MSSQGRKATTTGANSLLLVANADAERVRDESLLIFGRELREMLIEERRQIVFGHAESYP